jgi:GxxExxY protein
MNDYILSNETYKLRGIFFEVHNKLGSIQKENAYCNAIEIIFKKLQIPYEREKRINLEFEGEKIADFFLDFIVFGKIAIEVKAKNFLSEKTSGRHCDISGQRIYR